MVFKDAPRQKAFGTSSAAITHLTFMFHETIFLSMVLNYFWKSHQTAPKQNLSPFLASHSLGSSIDFSSPLLPAGSCGREAATCTWQQTQQHKQHNLQITSMFGKENKTQILHSWCCRIAFSIFVWEWSYGDFVFEPLNIYAWQVWVTQRKKMNC